MRDMVLDDLVHGDEVNWPLETYVNLIHMDFEHRWRRRDEEDLIFNEYNVWE